MMSKVVKIIAEEFDNFESGHEATQFLRGELFIFVDSLLANCDQEDLKRDEFRDVLDFMDEVFHLIVRWLELFPTKYMKYYEVHKKYKKAYLVDLNVAVAASGPELIAILDNCFYHHIRIHKITKYVKLKEEEAETDWYFNKRKDMRFKVALCYSFGSRGGFDALINFCNAQAIDTQEDKAMPLIYVNALLDSISEIVEEFRNPQIKENLLTEIKKAIIGQVDNITDEDVVKLETSQLNNLVEKLKYFGSLSEISDKEMEETMELKLCHKLLRCPIFERRRQGMINLITIIESLEEDESKDNKGYYFRRKKKQYEWLTSEYFLGWIKEQKIIDYVYGEYSHPEIIRKSGELLVKMCKYDLFTKKEVDIIWKVFESNYHEDIIRATLEVIEMLVKC